MIKRNVRLAVLWAAVIIPITACRQEHTAGSSKYSENGWEAGASGGSIRVYVKKYPRQFAETAKILAQAGFFKDKTFYELKTALLDNFSDSIIPQDPDDGLAYIRAVRDTMLPLLEQDFTEDFSNLKQDSELLEDICYSTGLTVTIADILKLNPAGAGTETVGLEGKKVIAFYHNKERQDHPDSPGSLRILGDFMLMLSPAQFPETMEEADYWLVLTPNYIPGDYYRTSSQSSRPVQEVYSFTAIDLYDAADGSLIRHVGFVKEKPPAHIYYGAADDRPPLEYPSLVSADVLTFIYRNINEPDTYRHMLEVYPGEQTSLGTGDCARVGTWELLLNTYDFVESFEDGSYLYTAGDGKRFLRCHFTVINHNIETMRFFPAVYYTGKDLSAELRDGNGNTYQPLGGVSSPGYFESTGFEPEESLDGYILFEVPAEAAGGSTAMELEFLIKPQRAVYILN